jgi:hypothetical protein
MSDDNDLPKYMKLSVDDGRDLLIRLGWEAVGADYFTLGSDRSVRHPLAVALDFEGERLSLLANELKQMTAWTGKIKDSTGDTTLFTTSELVLVNREKIEKLVEDQFRLTELERRCNQQDMRLNKLEAFKDSLAEWLKTLVNPPGSREWVTALKKMRGEEK